VAANADLIKFALSVGLTNPKPPKPSIMKKATDPRHKHRQQVVKQLFSFSFNNLPQPGDQTSQIVSKVNDLDAHISRNAPEWPINQINRIDLAVLRLAVYELTHTNTPPKVIIDEAVELGKEYGSQSSAKFINGVLGNVLKQLQNDPSN